MARSVVSALMTDYDTREIRRALPWIVQAMQADPARRTLIGLVARLLGMQADSGTATSCGQEWLAGALGVTTRTVQRQVAQLERWGWLDVSRSAPEWTNGTWRRPSNRMGLDWRRALADMGALDSFNAVAPSPRAPTPALVEPMPDVGRSAGLAGLASARETLNRRKT